MAYYAKDFHVLADALYEYIGSLEEIRGDFKRIIAETSSRDSALSPVKANFTQFFGTARGPGLGMRQLITLAQSLDRVPEYKPKV